jgi:hypothetical protein
VERVLKEVRRKAGEVGMPFNMDPQAYSLRIAEDDGTPDYDTPRTATPAVAMYVLYM